MHISPTTHSRPPRRLNGRRRRGFTLTEIAIVLGIISIILAAIWIAAGQVNEKARITEAVNQFNAVAQNMTSLMQGGFGITASQACGAAPPCDITTKMITGQAIPTWLATGGTTASTPWDPNGLYVRWMSDSPRTYRMSFYNVPIDACVALIMQTTSCTSGQSGCPTKVWTGGKYPSASTYVAPGSGSGTATGGIVSTTAQSLCDASGCTPAGSTCNTYPGGSGISNSVEFDFTQ